LIIRHEARCSPSWMVSLSTTRSNWPMKIKRQQPSLLHGESFATGDVIHIEKHWDHLSKNNGNSVPQHDA
jgi:hypothetical protein